MLVFHILLLMVGANAKTVDRATRSVRELARMCEYIDAQFPTTCLNGAFYSTPYTQKQCHVPDTFGRLVQQQENGTLDKNILVDIVYNSWGEPPVKRRTDNAAMLYIIFGILLVELTRSFYGRRGGEP